MKQKYYVYIYQDPADMQPLYVGKGKGSRSHFHIKEARQYISGKPSARNINILKVERIANILRTGREPIITKVFEGTHDECLQEERRLVLAIGRTPHGPLLNLTDGGDGTEGYHHSDHTRALLSILRGTRGYPHSEDHKQRLRDDNKGGAATRKPVIKFTLDGQKIFTYPSMTALAKELGTPKNNCAAHIVKDGSLPKEGFFYRYADSGDITEEGIKDSCELIKRREMHQRGAVSCRAIAKLSVHGGDILATYESVRAAVAANPETKYDALWSAIKHDRVYKNTRWKYV